MRTPSVLVALSLLLTQLLGQDFQPIPDEQQELYRYDLARLYFADEAAREACELELLAALDEIEKSKGKLASDPQALLEVLRLLERTRSLESKLFVAGYLEYARDTEASVHLEAARKISAQTEARLAFVTTAIQGLSDETLALFQTQQPAISDFYFYLKETRRSREHTLPLAKEELLAGLNGPLLDWTEDLYQLLTQRVQYPTIEIDGVEHSVRNDFSQLLRNPDRSVRERTYRGFHDSLAKDAELFSFTLLEKIQTKNQLAQLRNFDDAVHESLHGMHVTQAEFDTLMFGLRQRADLYKRYQQLVAGAIAQRQQLDSVEPWDLRVPLVSQEPRYTIEEGLTLVQEALAILGYDYSDELTALLDPAQRRLDLNGDSQRIPGAFAWGGSGIDWVFYAQSYDGFLSDVSTLAHEAGHAVHAGLIKSAGVSPLYDDGPRYFTEGFAMLNELLVLQHALTRATDAEQRLYFQRELCQQLTVTIRLARYVLFEAELYRRDARGELADSGEISHVWRGLGAEFDIFNDRIESSQHAWAQVPHFFTHPLYNTNYVFANLMATLLYTRLQSEPELVDAYLELLATGFPDAPAVLLKRYLDISLVDPASLQAVFEEIERQLDALEAALKAQS